MNNDTTRQHPSRRCGSFCHLLSRAVDKAKLARLMFNGAETAAHQSQVGDLARPARCVGHLHDH